MLQRVLLNKEPFLPPFSLALPGCTSVLSEFQINSLSLEFLKIRMFYKLTQPIKCVILHINIAHIGD